MKRTITLAVIGFWTLLFVTGSTEAKRPQLALPNRLPPR